MEVNKIYEGDALSVLKTFESKIFNTIVTSPPYYGLRAYGTDPVIWDGDENCQHEFTKEVKKGITGGKNSDKVQIKGSENFQVVADSKHGFCKKCGAWRGELGSEPSPELFIKHLVDIFREAKRTLRDDGTLWVNMGDSYAGSGGAHTKDHANPGLSKSTERDGLPHYKQDGGRGIDKISYGLKPKDLIGIPWMLAFALRADGWYLRMDNIWYKRNPMPESVTDRPTKAHEYFFLLSKSSNYYYDADAIKEKCITNENRPDGIVRDRILEYDSKQAVLRKQRKPAGWDTRQGAHGAFHREGRAKDIEYTTSHSEYRNKRSVWDIATQPFSEAHFATFPEKLIVDCIKAGCPEGGLVLDPFGGANTTGVVSRKLNRNYVAIELNPKYIKIGEKREYEQIGLFL